MKIAVIYWTGTGNTEAMANAIALGAQKTCADVSVFPTSAFCADRVAEYDGFALGCPAMGAEELEDSEFQPLYESLKPMLSGKKIVLFGSYGWGNGEYMNAWKEDALAAGVVLVGDLTIENEPDEEGKNKCEELGKILALT